MPGADAAELPVLPVFDSYRALALEQNALCPGMNLDLEGRSLHRGTKVTDRGARAAPPANSHLEGADSFLVGTVKIGIEFIADLLTAGDERVMQFVARAQVAYREWPADV